MSPLSARDSVERILTIVVLPAPFGPSRAKTVPSATDRSMPSRTTFTPYALRNPRTAIAGWFEFAAMPTPCRWPLSSRQHAGNTAPQLGGWASNVAVRLCPHLDHAVGPAGTPRLTGGVERGERVLVDTDDNVGLERAQRDQGTREVRRERRERCGRRPAAVADQAPVVEVTLDDHQGGGGEPGGQLWRQVVEGERGAVERVGLEVEVPASQPLPEPRPDRRGLAAGGAQPVQAREQVGAGGVGDVVRV